MNTQQTADLKQQIESLQKEILNKKKQLTELKHNLPLEEVVNHSFRAWDGTEPDLSDLFGDHDELIFIHNMGKRCPYCTLWADGFNSLLHHLENRAAFVVASPDDPERRQLEDLLRYVRMKRTRPNPAPVPR